MSADDSGVPVFSGPSLKGGDPSGMSAEKRAEAASEKKSEGKGMAREVFFGGLPYSVGFELEPHA